MEDPYRAFSGSARDKLLAASLISTIGLSFVLQALDQSLRTPAAPTGILSFEFAGSLLLAGNMLASWGPEARVDAALSLGIDYVYLFSYPLCLSLACARVASGVSIRFPSLAAVGVYLAWLMFVAGALDAVENLALIQLLRGSDWEAWPRVAMMCAFPKFALVATGLIYIPTAAFTPMILRKPPA